MLAGGPDVGLITEHLRRGHEETAIFPRALLSRGERQHWRCPLCPWSITWDYDGTGGDEDMGLVVARHVDRKHPQLIWGDFVPAHVVARMSEIRRVGRRAS